MKPVLLLVLVFTVAACGEVYDASETPYIVSIDPPRQMLDHESLRHYGLIPYLIRLNQEDVRTLKQIDTATPTVGNSSDANSP